MQSIVSQVLESVPLFQLKKYSYLYPWHGFAWIVTSVVCAELPVPVINKSSNIWHACICEIFKI